MAETSARTHAPDAFARAEPIFVAPSNRVTLLSASADPPTAFAPTDVTTGGAGLLVSMATTPNFDAAPWLPAASTARAVRKCVPSDSVVDVMDQLPDASVLAVPSVVAPSVRVTVVPMAAVPIRIGVLMFVTRSDDDRPVSDAVSS